MDSDYSPEDSTKVRLMLDEYRSFVEGGKRRSQSKSIASRLGSGRLSFSAGKLLGTSGFDRPILHIEGEESANGGDTGNSALHEQKVELLAAKGKICRLETELNNMENNAKRMRLDHSRESTDFKMQIQRDQTDRDEVMLRLRRATQKEESLMIELDECKEEIGALRDRTKELENMHMSEKEKLNKILVETKRKADKEIFDMKERLDRKCMEAMSSKLKFEEMSAKEAHLKRKVNCMVSQEEYDAVKLNLEKAQHKIKELEEQLARIDEGNNLGVKLQSDLARLKETEKQNAKLVHEVNLLKEGSENFMLLQEKYESTLSKLKRAESYIVELQKLEFENEALKKKVKSWEYKDEHGEVVVRSPEALIKHISSLQKDQIALKEEIGTLSASKDIHENAFQKLLEKYRALKDNFNTEKIKEAAYEAEMKKIKRRLFLAIAERDGIRNILDQEVSDQTTSFLGERKREIDDKVQLYNKEIANLEKELEISRKEAEQYRIKSQNLELELETAQIKLAVQNKSQKKVENADQDARIAALKKENEALEKKVLLLEAEIETKGLKGCLDPSKTKVLHMAFNPYSKIRQSREEEYRALKLENEKLKGALASAQGGGKSGESSENPISYATAETKELSAQLESAQLKYKRLHEVFEEKVKQFREACYQLFGYRIDVKGSSKYHLFPMYADSPHDFFIFQYHGGDLQMVETGFSKSWQDAVEMFLFRGNSIPAFLSAVTTKLFANQTVIRDTSIAGIVPM